MMQHPHQAHIPPRLPGPVALVVTALRSSQAMNTVLGIYFGALLLMGSILVYRATPMSGIDEMFHFKRALQVSEGQFLARKLGPNDWGGRLDRQTLDYERWFDTLRNSHRRAGVAEAQDVARFVAGQQPGRLLESFPSTASYPPLPYLPAAAGLVVARVLHADPLTTLYAGRLASLLGYLLMLAAVVAMLPVGRIGALAILSTPTALHLAASYSADPIANTVSALFAAWCIRLRLETRHGFSTGNQVLFVLLAVAVGLLKLTCALCGLLSLMIPAAAFSSVRRGWIVRLLATGGCVGASLAWNLSYPFVPATYWHSGGNPSAALHMILAAPLHESLVVAQNVLRDGYFWWVDGYSRFCTGPLPFYFLFNGPSAALGLAIVWLLCLAENRGPTLTWTALLLVAVACASAVEILFAFKIGFSPPSSVTITGLQGRYFLLPLALFYLGVSLGLPARIGWSLAVAPLLGIYLLLTLHLVIALLGAYAPNWS